MSLEYCIECDEATGDAGIGEGSLYVNGYGPLCPGCYEDNVDEEKL